MQEKNGETICQAGYEVGIVATRHVWRNRTLGCDVHLVNHFRPKTVDQIHQISVELAPVHLHHRQPLRKRGLKILLVREVEHKAHGERVTSKLPSLSDELNDTGCIGLRLQKGRDGFRRNQLS